MTVNLLTFTRQFLQNKKEHMTPLYIWIAITAILITGTLFWNFYLANRKIESEVEIKYKKILNENENEKKELIKLLNSKIEESNNKFTESINGLFETASNKLNEELKKELESNKREFDRIWGDIHRSFGAVAETSNDYSSIVQRAFCAITHYAVVGDHESTIGELIDDIKNTLEKPEAVQQIKEDESFLLDTWIKLAQTFIPDTVGSSKKFIISKLKECQK